MLPLLWVVLWLKQLIQKSRSVFCAVFPELWFEVVDGEEAKATLAERSLAKPCLMVFWPCNACWRLDGPREPATQYGRAIIKGRAETSEVVQAGHLHSCRYNACTAVTQRERMHCRNTKTSHTACVNGLCVCVCV